MFTSQPSFNLRLTDKPTSTQLMHGYARLLLIKVPS